MEKYLRIRLTSDEHRRIQAIASAQELSLNAFVHKVLMAAVRDKTHQVEEKADLTKILFVGVRHGGRGYKQSGEMFADWMKKGSDRRGIGALRRMLEVVDTEMLRNENFKPALDWCLKHYSELMAQIPRRRQTSFAQGFILAYTKK